jgi:hypothetical protein
MRFSSFGAVLRVVLVLSAFLAFSEAHAYCPYSSIQARVQPNLQTPWTHALSVNLNQFVHVGAMYNATGNYAPGYVYLTLTHPNGYVQPIAIDAYFQATQLGRYTLRATCDGLQDVATVDVVSPCPYSSVQARLRPNATAVWTQTLTANPNVPLYLAALYNGTYDYAGSTSLTLTYPNGSVMGLSNNAYLSFPTAGTYRLTAKCGLLQNVATLTVSTVACSGTTSTATCTTQARVRPNAVTAWTSSLSVESGKPVDVRGLYNSLPSTAVALTLSGPNGYQQPLALDSNVTPPLPGTYTLAATYAGQTHNASVNVTHPAPTLSAPPNRPTYVYCDGPGYMEYWGPNTAMSVSDLYDVGPGIPGDTNPITTESEPPVLRSVIYWPRGMCSNLNTPIIFLMHGQGQNYQGYTYLASALTEKGYVVVSIDGSWLPKLIDRSQSTRWTSWPIGYDVSRDTEGNQLMLLRARLVLKHMEKWTQWSRDPANWLFGRIDMNQVGLIGHSRGGPAVRAAYNLLYPEQHGLGYLPIPETNDRSYRWPLAQVPQVRAIFEIAPEDFANPISPQVSTIDADGVAWASLLPLCDRDISEMSGMYPFDRMLRKHIDELPKATMAVPNANHNYYNTISPNEQTVGCIRSVGLGYESQPLLDPGVQRESALQTVVPFMHAWVNTSPVATRAWMFDPRYYFTIPGILPLPRNYNGSQYNVLSAIFDDFSTVDSYPNQSSAAVMPGVVNINAAERMAPTNPQLTEGDHDPIQRAAWIQWPGPITYDVYGPPMSLVGYNYLQFRAARRPDALNSTAQTTFRVQLIYDNNSTSTFVDVPPLEGPYGGGPSSGAGYDLNVSLQTIRIQLDAFGTRGNVKAVRYSFAGQGSIYLANVRFSRD